MQLITYLILKGDEVSIVAVWELNRREADFGVDQHSMRLRQLISPEARFSEADALMVKQHIKLHGPTGTPVMRNGSRGGSLVAGLKR